MEEGKAKEVITCSVCGDEITTSKKEMLEGHYYCLGCYSDEIVNVSQDSDNTDSGNMSKEPSGNLIGTIGKAIGFCIIVAGFIVGGMLFIGLSEIINLLQRINEKL